MCARARVCVCVERERERVRVSTDDLAVPEPHRVLESPGIGWAFSRGLGFVVEVVCLEGDAHLVEGGKWRGGVFRMNAVLQQSYKQRRNPHKQTINPYMYVSINKP